MSPSRWCRRSKSRFSCPRRHRLLVCPLSSALCSHRGSVMKRNLLALAALAVVGMLLAGAAEKKEDAPKKTKAPYVHTVIFTLKKDAPKDEAAAMIADCHELLAKIPTVRELRAGRPAEKGTPNL